MTDAKFTPGPWSCDDTGVIRHENQNGYWQPVIIASAWKEDAWQMNAQAVANGRLMAAAPDLYECARILASLDEGDKRGRRFPTREECDKARSALAKVSPQDSGT